MGRIAQVVKTLFQTRGAAPGKSVVVQTNGAGGEERTTEVWHNPGVSSGPTPEDRAAVLEIPAGGRVIVATHNYKIEVDAAAGETIIYSTNAAGDTKQAEIKLTTDGNIDLNGTGRTLVTHAELDTAIQGLVSYINGHTHSGVTTGTDPSGPPAAPTSVDISAAEAETLRTGT